MDVMMLSVLGEFEEDQIENKHKVITKLGEGLRGQWNKEVDDNGYSQGSTDVHYTSAPNFSSRNST